MISGERADDKGWLGIYYRLCIWGMCCMNKRGESILAGLFSIVSFNLDGVLGVLTFSMEGIPQKLVFIKRVPCFLAGCFEERPNFLALNFKSNH